MVEHSYRRVTPGRRKQVGHRCWPDICGDTVYFGLPRRVARCQCGKPATGWTRSWGGWASAWIHHSGAWAWVNRVAEDIPGW